MIFISAKNVKGGQLDFTDRKYISKYEHNCLTRTAKPSAGDLLLTKSGSLGDVAVVPDLDFEFSIFESLALLKLRKEIVDPYYLHQYIRSPESARYFHGITTGLAVKHLHLGDLRKLKVPVPSLPVQRKIAEILGTWDDAIEKLEALRAAKEEQFRWLQQRLIDQNFNGYSNVLEQYAQIPILEKITSVDGLQPLTVKLHCKGIMANGRDAPVILSESVRKLHDGLQSFRIMRRIEASFRKASALALRHSQSRARRRQRPSQAKVRSTIQRLGSTTKPLA